MCKAIEGPNMTSTPRHPTLAVPSSPGQALSASLESETISVVAAIGDTARNPG